MTDVLGPLPEPDVMWVDGKDQWGYDDYSSAYSADALVAFAAQQVAAERERCAKVCEGLEEYFTDSRYDPARFAAAIRNGV
jgi:hypothetical protein